MQAPWLSVVIATHNGASTILRAVLSVIEQGFADVEIVVVDDGSTDATLKVVWDVDGPIRSCRLNQASGGPARPRNVGAREATGTYILFLDDDDVMLPGSLEFFRDHRFLADIVFGNILVRDVRGLKADYQIFQDVPDVTPLRLIRANQFSLHAALVVRRVFLDSGGFDESASLHSVEDWHLWIRLAVGGATFAGVDHLVGIYLLRDGSISNCDDGHYVARLNMFESLLGELPDLEELLNARVAEAKVELIQRRFWLVARQRGLQRLTLWLKAVSGARWGQPGFRTVVGSLLRLGVRRSEYRT